MVHILCLTKSTEYKEQFKLHTITIFNEKKNNRFFI